MRSGTSSERAWLTDSWPDSSEELRRLQRLLAVHAAQVRASDAWRPTDSSVLGGCFVVFAPAPERLGNDLAWAAAVACRPVSVGIRSGGPWRRSDDALRGISARGAPRHARDVDAQSAATGEAGGGYEPGLLALRQGPTLSRAVGALAVRPDVLLVDATGLDHPRRAGLAVHLGAVLDLPTVGVTHRSLLATGDRPSPVRGSRCPAVLEGEEVGAWVCTRTGARPVLAHAAWRTDPEVAAETVLAASTDASRTPVPLQEARRAAREARALALRT